MENVKVKIININNLTNEDLNLASKYMPNKFSLIKKIKSEKVRLMKFASLYFIINNITKNEDDIVYNEYKKPLLKNNEKFFNISNSNDYSVYVEGSDLIGIDIQKIEEKNLKIKNFAFTKNESNFIILNPLENFHILWTRKESFLKAIGTGFDKRPEELGFEFVKDSDLNNIVYMGMNFYFLTVKFLDYYITVCSKNEYKNIDIEVIK